MAHGTTTGTNALIERKGAVTGLLTTDGFRDVLEIMRTDRETGYDLHWEKPRPLVARRYRRDVRERVGLDGVVETPLDEAQVVEVLRELAALGVESVAVSFLHSYANPSHERRVRELAAAEMPPASTCRSRARSTPSTVSSSAPTTVAIDAYIKPVMVRYIERLIDGAARAAACRATSSSCRAAAG